MTCMIPEISLLNLADDKSNINALENEIRNLPDNYETAYKQLVHTEKRLFIVI